jgi:hypothetical protein
LARVLAFFAVVMTVLAPQISAGSGIAAAGFAGFVRERGEDLRRLSPKSLAARCADLPIAGVTVFRSRRSSMFVPTVSRCAARRRLSMTARLSSPRKKNCTPPRSVANGFWPCGKALPGVDQRRKVGDREALVDQLWSAIKRLPDPEPRPDPRRPSKQDVVIAMLRQPEGATVDEVASVTGWQRHTVRGVFSGT